MLISSVRHTVLLITANPDRVLMRAFPEAAPDMDVRHVKSPRTGKAYVSGLGEYADRGSYPMPQIILLDLDPAPPPALEFLEWLKERSETRHIPVVVLSSRGEAVVVDTAYALGANSCVLKSVDEQITNDLVRGIGAYATLATQARHAAF